MPATLASAGCNSTNNPAFENQNRNFFNLVKVEPHSFAYRYPQTFELRSNDAIEKPDITGDKVSILGGLFTYVDY